MLHCAKEEGPETAELGVDGIQPVPRQQPGEEFLGQIASLFLIAPGAPNEGEHRRVISGGQVTERRLRLRGIAARLQDARPMCGRKCAWGRRRVVVDGHHLFPAESGPTNSKKPLKTSPVLFVMENTSRGSPRKTCRAPFSASCRN